MKRLFGVLPELRVLHSVYRGGKLPRGAADVRVAVVLGTQVMPDGSPSETLAARVRHAARLYASGRVSLLIPTGGLGRHPPAEADVMARALRDEGVPGPAVMLEDRALNTWDSAVRVSRLTEKVGVREVLVVTDPLHCVRAVVAFETAGLEAWADPAYGSPMWRDRWQRLGQLGRETVALVWYGVKYGVGSRSRP